nr:hypothetical protein [Actinomycetota bacterium]
MVARWVDIFGKSNVTLLIVNEAQPTFLFDEINKFLNLPTGSLNAAPSGSNRSLTMEEISLLLELNRQFPKERVWDEYEVFVRAGYIRHLTDHVPPAADKARLLTLQWAVDKANELGKVIQKELLGTGGTYTLTNTSNAITTLAGSTGTVSFVENSGFTIGTVNTVGLTTTGNTTLS